MKILVISDSHGEINDLKWLLEQVYNDYGPMDALIHCGDGINDVEMIRGSIGKQNPGILIYTVAGNCDFRTDAPLSQIIETEGVTIYVTHGHLYGVKTDLSELDRVSASKNCSLTLYGHTHIPNWEMKRTLTVNPGSARDGRAALVTVGNGTYSAKLLEY